MRVLFIIVLMREYKIFATEKENYGTRSRSQLKPKSFLYGIYIIDNIGIRIIVLSTRITELLNNKKFKIKNNR